MKKDRIHLIKRAAAVILALIMTFSRPPGEVRAGQKTITVGKSNSNYITTIYLNSGDWTNCVTASCNVKSGRFKKQAGEEDYYWYLLAWDKADANWAGETDSCEIRTNGNHFVILVEESPSGSRRILERADFEVTNIDSQSPVIGDLVYIPDTGLPPEEAGGTIVMKNCSDAQSGLPEKPYLFLRKEEASAYRNSEGTWNFNALKALPSWQASPEFHAMESGTYCCLVRDKIQGVSSREIQVDIDREHPEITGKTLQLSDRSGSYGRGAVITVAARDTGTGLAEEAFSFGENGGWQKDGVYQTAENGMIPFRVRDKAGNQVTDRIEVAGVDLEAPQLSIREEQADKKTGSVRIVISARDSGSGVAGISYRNDAVGVPVELKQFRQEDGNGVESAEAELIVNTNGSYTFFVKDGVGNETSDRINVVKVEKETSKSESGESGGSGGGSGGSGSGGSGSGSGSSGSGSGSGSSGSGSGSGSSGGGSGSGSSGSGSGSSGSGSSSKGGSSGKSGSKSGSSGKSSSKSGSSGKSSSKSGNSGSGTSGSGSSGKNSGEIVTPIVPGNSNSGEAESSQGTVIIRSPSLQDTEGTEGSPGTAVSGSGSYNRWTYGESGSRSSYDLSEDSEDLETVSEDETDLAVISWNTVSDSDADFYEYTDEDFSLETYLSDGEEEEAEEFDPSLLKKEGKGRKTGVLIGSFFLILLLILLSLYILYRKGLIHLPGEEDEEEEE